MKTKKSPHMEKIIAKKAPHQGEDVAKRPPHVKKKEQKGPPIQRKKKLFFQGVGERLLLHPLRVSMHNSLCLGLLIYNET